MLTIRPFKPQDALEIEARQPDRAILESLPNLLEVAKANAAGGPAWTGCWDGKPIAAAGLVILWGGVCEGWALTSDWVRDHPCAFHRAIARKLKECISEKGLWRVQLSIPQSHFVSCAWAQRLGFESEGVMHKFGPDGGDYIRFALVQPRPEVN